MLFILLIVLQMSDGTFQPEEYITTSIEACETKAASRSLDILKDPLIKDGFWKCFELDIPKEEPSI